MNQGPLVIAVANRKGGTGKTTTAVNLAAEWGNQGYKTLLIDLDTQGHSAIGLGCRELRQRGENAHQLFHDSKVELISVAKQTSAGNVWLAPADTDFCMQNLEVMRIREAIKATSIADMFQRIVIDTPPTLDGLLISGLAAAQGVVIPFIPHHLAEVGVRQLAKLFYQVATRHNPDLKLLGLLPIMYDRHIRLHQRVIAELSKQFGKNRLMHGIRSNIKLAEAFEAGIPVGQYDPYCAGSMDYRLMARDLEIFFNVEGTRKW